MHIFFAFLTLVGISISSQILHTPQPEVLAESTTTPDILEATQPLHTQSRFNDRLETAEILIPRKIITQDDAETEVGEEKVLQEGSDGKKTVVTKITLFEGQEYSREIVSTDIQSSTDKTISKGTKIIWHTLDTPDGPIKYWRKMRVYATHYDSHCHGCDEWTAIGMRAGKGVIAVDPKVIKLRSNVYILGYGKAVAGDTGGAIKGNIIDLGFEDARTADWSARFTDIYLLDKAPS